jgi:hypothetical protein
MRVCEHRALGGNELSVTFTSLGNTQQQSSQHAGSFTVLLRCRSGYMAPCRDNERRMAFCSLQLETALIMNQMIAPRHSYPNMTVQRPAA